MVKRILSGVVVALTVVASAGCRGERPVDRQVVGWRGPTETMAAVVAAVNENNVAIPSMWSRHYFEGNIVDDRGKSQFVNAEGVLLVLKPDQMRLVGKKDFVGTIIDIGTDGERFWMSVPERVSTMWWGYNRNIGRPCAKGIPVQPEGILQVLGVGEFNTNFAEPPVPVMRFNADADAYMFVWNQPYQNRWAATKEVWYDRRTKRPKLVLLFDENGRVLVRAYLEEHRRVEVDGKAEGQWPWVATRYRLFFPESGSKITLQLREMRLENEGVPNDRSIAFPNPRTAGVSKEVQIDKDCD